MTFVRIIAIALMLGTGCAHVDRTTLVGSLASLGCDWAQTRSTASQGWVVAGEQRVEYNPIMGSRPTPRIVDSYFMVAAALDVAVWAVLPRTWRSAAPVAIMGVQARAIARNVDTTGTVCGL